MYTGVRVNLTRYIHRESIDMCPHLRPLVRESESGGLELEVGVLSAGHLVLVDLCRARLLAALEGGVREADALPVFNQLGQPAHKIAGQYTHTNTHTQRERER